MYDELIAELRQHHCNAKEDDTQEVCEECAYDVIIADKSVPSGIASVCVCGLMNKAADAIEELQEKLITTETDLSDFKEAMAWKEHFDILTEQDCKPHWIPVTERLPEKGKYVLCFCRADIVCVLRRDKDGDWYENPTHVYMSGFVTHWMPLPQSPKEKT